MFDDGAVADAGVVDQDVDAAPCCGDFADQGVACVPVDDVEGPDPEAFVFHEFFGQSCERAGACGDDDPVVRFFIKEFCESESDSGAAAGDKDNGLVFGRCRHGGHYRPTWRSSCNRSLRNSQNLNTERLAQFEDRAPIMKMKILAVAFTFSMFALCLEVQAQSAAIGRTQVEIVLGDLTQQPVEGLVIPQFDGGVSWGGVGGAVARRGGSDGLNEAEKYFETHNVMYGDAFITDSPAMGKKLIHVISVASKAENEFATVQLATINALDQASLAGLRSIGIPALGTGIIGQLTGRQSAEAILSAIKTYADKGGMMPQVKVVIYGDRAAYDDFVKVLKNGSYASVDTKQIGERVFDTEAWMRGMRMDSDLEFVEVGTVTPVEDCSNLVTRMWNRLRGK